MENNSISGFVVKKNVLSPFWCFDTGAENNHMLPIVSERTLDTNCRLELPLKNALNGETVLYARSAQPL